MNYFAEIVQALKGLLPDCDDQLCSFYALLVVTTGTLTTLKDVHDAWAAWRNLTKPDHKSLIPFDDLSKDVQALDAPYRDAIVQVAMDRILKEV